MVFVQVEYGSGNVDVSKICLHLPLLSLSLCLGICLYLQQYYSVRCCLKASCLPVLLLHRRLWSTPFAVTPVNSCIPLFLPLFNPCSTSLSVAFKQLQFILPAPKRDCLALRPPAILPSSTHYHLEVCWHFCLDHHSQRIVSDFLHNCLTLGYGGNGTSCLPWCL